jgi:hypothetical protein
MIAKGIFSLQPVTRETKKAPSPSALTKGFHDMITWREGKEEGNFFVDATLLFASFL